MGHASPPQDFYYYECSALVNYSSFLTANEIHFVCGGKCCQYRQHKNATSNSKENPTMDSRQEPVLALKPRKRG